jgi:hypothetical protein
MLDRFHTVWCSAATGTDARPASPPLTPPRPGGTSGGAGGRGRVVVVVSAADDGWIRLADIAIMLPLVLLDRSGKAAAVIYRSQKRQWLARHVDLLVFILVSRDRVMYVCVTGSPLL